MDDGDLEQRIGAAAAFARSEYERLEAESLVAESAPKRTGLAMLANSYLTTAVVLEEVLDPGRHSSQPPPDVD